MQEGLTTRPGSEGESHAEKEIDLNLLFPDAGKDLNALFPEYELKFLLKKIHRNRKEIYQMTERFQNELQSGVGESPLGEFSS